MDGLIVEMVSGVKGKLPQYRVAAFGNKKSGDEYIFFRKMLLPLEILQMRLSWITTCTWYPGAILLPNFNEKRKCQRLD